MSQKGAVCTDEREQHPKAYPMQEGEVGDVWFWKVRDSADSGVDCAGEMLFVVHRTDDDRFVINRVNVEGEERSLDTQHVPPCNLVTARHRVESLSTDYSVPGLKL